MAMAITVAVDQAGFPNWYRDDFSNTPSGDFKNDRLSNLFYSFHT